MKKTFSLLALLALLTVSNAALAGNGTGKQAKAVHGKVEKVDGTTITILTKGVESTIETNANTKFFLDDQPATIADVQAKQRLFASAGTGPAAEVRLTTRHRKGDTATTAPTTEPT